VEVGVVCPYQELVSLQILASQVASVGLIVHSDQADILLIGGRVIHGQVKMILIGPFLSVLLQKVMKESVMILPGEEPAHF